jgi:hypothetical protein
MDFAEREHPFERFGPAAEGFQDIGDVTILRASFGVELSNPSCRGILVNPGDTRNHDDLLSTGSNSTPA